MPRLSRLKRTSAWRRRARKRRAQERDAYRNSERPLSKGPTGALLAGRRALEGMPGVRIVSDYFPCEEDGMWVLQLELSLPKDIRSGLVPRVTNWFVLVSPDYPHGPIRFHPAVSDGIAATFPHQMFNGIVVKNRLWRSGFLCLNHPDRSLGRAATEHSPTSVSARLSWNVGRALGWLTDAASGELRQDGDYFELPNFLELSSFSVAYHDVPGEAGRPAATGDWGYLDLAKLPNNRQQLFVKDFLDSKAERIYSPLWGSHLHNCAATYRGLWVQLQETPVILPWQAPQTWGELLQCCASQGVDLDGIMRSGLGRLRDGARHFLSLGYRIPETVGGENRQHHWQTLELPTLSTPSSQRGGFRPGSTGLWRLERRARFADERQLTWCASKNWAADEINSWGRRPVWRG